MRPEKITLPAAGAFASLADHGEIITHTVGRKESGFFCIAFFICFQELERPRLRLWQFLDAHRQRTRDSGCVIDRAGAS
jgi:hypothetical protein